MQHGDFTADLHIHSRFSMATSKKLNVPVLAGWAALKGINVLGTGDFTHPVWRAELADNLEFEEESGFYRVKRPADIVRALPDAPAIVDSPLLKEAAAQTRFVLQAEISSIYKRGGQVRKVHNLVYMPTLEAADNFSRRLAEIGNITSDGRPILGIDSRDLLELVLQTDPRAYLIPAHIWTPWFSLFGSKSGFDRLEDCYADLSEHIFALETGLSSDPEMNRCLSALDNYKLVSNSDAHSGENLAREANLFNGKISYDGMFGALKAQSQNGLDTQFKGTYEFFPDEGKYHLDGHRACNVSLTPAQTRELGGICPVCGRPLTVGVLYRVMELADRAEPVYGPDESFKSLIPLPEMIGEVLGVGSKSVKVVRFYQELLSKLGSELDILLNLPTEDIARYSGTLAEGITRMRAGRVSRKGGFDGEFGVISAFTPEEQRDLKKVAGGRGRAAASMLPGMPELPKKTRAKAVKQPKTAANNSETEAEADPANNAFANAENLPGNNAKAADAAGLTAPKAAKTAAVHATGAEHNATAGARADADNAENTQSPLTAEQEAALQAEKLKTLYSTLNERQLAAVQAGPGPVITLAGPGTGKTHTLIARIRRLVAEGVASKRILALTFTRRAAQELDERLQVLLAENAAAHSEDGKFVLPRTDTLHALALEFWHKVQGESPVLLNEESAMRVFNETNAAEPARVRKEAWRVMNLCREKREPLPEEYQPFFQRYTNHKDVWNQADYTDLLEFWLSQVKGGLFAKPWEHILVDEIQDLSPLQLELVAAITRDGGNGFFGIGDPNQSIYGFRGAHENAADYFKQLWPRTDLIYLQQNFRSATKIVNCVQQLFNKLPGVTELTPVRDVTAEIHYFEAGSAESEATWIAGLVREFLGVTSHTLQDVKTSNSALRGPYSPGDIAILARSRVLLQPVRKALERLGIPCTQPSFDPFWHDVRVDKILQVAGQIMGISLPRAEGSEAKSFLPECPNKVLYKGPESMAAYWCNSEPFDSGFWKSAPFKDLVKAYALHGNWPNLLNWLGLQNELEQVRAKAEKVQLLTLHAAKGLEFPIVFLPALEEGLLPFAGKDFLNGHPPVPENVAEELRLFYVGATRAKEGLFLSHAQKRRIYAREHRLQPSTFLRALPLGMVKHTQLVARVSSRVEQLKLF